MSVWHRPLNDYEYDFVGLLMIVLYHIIYPKTLFELLRPLIVSPGFTGSHVSQGFVAAFWCFH